jgi:RNA polymerase sigma-70 factor (ECF subfamily)
MDERIEHQAEVDGGRAEVLPVGHFPWRARIGSTPAAFGTDERVGAGGTDGGLDGVRPRIDADERLALPGSTPLRHHGGAEASQPSRTSKVRRSDRDRGACEPSMSDPAHQSDGREAAAAKVRLSDAFAGASDHDLVRAIQAADQDAFAELVARHEGRAYRVARQLVPDADEARDVAQEAFLRIFKNSERFDFEHEFTTWLYRIVTNLCIDHLRRRRPRTVGGEEDEPGPEVVDEGALAPSQRLEQSETAALVRACVARLPEHFRVVIALRELEGLTCQEISRIVGATPVTVRWRLHRARKLFAEQWERLHERGARDYLSSPTAAELARLPRAGDGEPCSEGAT